MTMFQDWAEGKFGVRFKRIKDRDASHVSFMIGFWWDSFERTRTLDETRLASYMSMLLDFASRRVLTLHDRQTIAGRMQRAVMTMPPGAACLLANTYSLMAGLTLPWHKRRTTLAERRDFRFFHDVLKLNMGQGYFSFDQFNAGPAIFSDASKQARYAGGGWVSACGAYDWFRFGASAARMPIDFLEGDTVVVALERMGASWRGKYIDFGIDNQAFERSAGKSWSRAARLTLLIKRIFILQIRHQCLLRFFWLSSEDNLLADHLSRGRVALFLAAVFAVGFWASSVLPRPMPDAGRVRVIDTSEPFNADDLACLEALRRPRMPMATYAAWVDAVVIVQSLARGFLARRRMARLLGADDGTFCVGEQLVRCITERSMAAYGGWGDGGGWRDPTPVYLALRLVSKGFRGAVDLHAYVPFYGRLGAYLSARCMLALVSAAVTIQSAFRGFSTRRANRYRVGAQGAAVPRRAVPMRGFTRIIFFALFWILGLASAGKYDGASMLDMSVQYPRASLYAGLPASMAARLDLVLDNRLSASSMRTVHAAVAHWRPIAAHFGWEEIIATDDPERGGKLSTFLIRLTDNTELVWDSIASYFWGLRWYMRLNRQADPAMGVMGLTDMTRSLMVLTHVPSEPRRAIPKAVILEMLDAVDESEFWEVQFAFFLVVMFFTFSRSECPCPKHFTGEDSFDENQHWQVRDILIAVVQVSRNALELAAYALKVRFKSTKSDPRIERPWARGDGTDRGASAHGGSDWSYVGDVPNSRFSPFFWYRKLMSFYDGPRDPASPFFMARDRQRPYTYTAAKSDLKVFLLRVGTDAEYGLHGLRVEGYNCSKEENGEDITVAHGGWQKGSNTRYDRFKLHRVLNIAAGMCGEDGIYSDGSVVRPREIQRETLVRGTGAAPSSSAPVLATVVPNPEGTARVEIGNDDYTVQHLVHEEAQAARSSASSPAPTSEALPPGWSVDAAGVFEPPERLLGLGAVRAPTLTAAWRVHRVASSLADTDEYVRR